MSKIPDYTPGGNARTGTAPLSSSGSGQPIQDKSCVDWVFVKGGVFQMGSTAGNLNEKTVTLNDFYISKTEVTNTQYATFLNAYGYDKIKSGEYTGQLIVNEHDWGIKKLGGSWRPSPGYENFPVVFVIWYGANEFCKLYGLRLPTEAEWEYAARGGVKSRRFKCSGSDDIDRVAWYFGNTGKLAQATGTKDANELQLFDMSGNVWEWCSDWYGDYSNNAQNDPQGPSSGSDRVLCGASWNLNAGFSRCTYRLRNNPDYKFIDSGFRSVRNNLTLALLNFSDCG